MSQYEYSPLYGLQAGTIRQAGAVAVFERIIDRLVDKIGSLKASWGGTDFTYDLTDRFTIEYPDTLMRLPHIAVSFVAEVMKEPGIGRYMVDGEAELTGFTKVIRFYFDIWTRKNLERFLISDAIVHTLGQSWKFFRQFGIRDIRHVGTQSRNYEQESSALYQRMTAQQASRVFRNIVEYEVEFDLVNVVPEEGEIIEEIIITGDVVDGITAVASTVIDTKIGGTTELILDKELVTTLKGVIP